MEEETRSGHTSTLCYHPFRCTHNRFARGAGGGVQVGPPIGGPPERVLLGGSVHVARGGIHLGAQGLEVRKGEVGRAAHGFHPRRPGGGAFGIQLGDGHDVGGGVEIALGVTANEFQVPSEGDVAFDDPRSHSDGGPVGGGGVFGELQWRAAVADGEGGFLINVNGFGAGH
jgi:hypothetical protein